MKTKMALAFGALAMLATPLAADWDPGDAHKMHAPQLPDPNGWDVHVDRPNILADDWQCRGDGDVDDIHFWGSWAGDNIGQIATILVRIHSDIPDPDGDGPLFSMPGNVLWERQFGETEFTVRQYGTGDQGWIEPNPNNPPPTYFPNDHNLYFQVNIEDIIDPFYQVQDTIYWLSLQTTIWSYDFGWKTSTTQWNDDAVYGFFDPEDPQPIVWNELVDPDQVSLDLAFVITPEPGTLLLLGLGGLLLRWRR
jgi:hypothetical protein